MARVEKTIDVEVPVRTAYNQWTQFEDFPEFMEGVHEVQQLDDTHLFWRAKVGGREKEWDAVIREQVPDEKIIWASVDGAENAGIVQFSSIGPNSTRVHLEMSYDPEGFTEHIGDALGFASRRIAGDLQRFKDFIEARGVETGAYRETHENPDVPGGHTRGTVGEADARGDYDAPPVTQSAPVPGAAAKTMSGMVTLPSGRMVVDDKFAPERALDDSSATIERAHGQGPGVLGAPSEISDTDAFNRPSASDAYGTRPEGTVAGEGGNMGREVNTPVAYQAQSTVPGHEHTTVTSDFDSIGAVPRAPREAVDMPTGDGALTVDDSPSTTEGTLPPVELHTPGALAPGSLSREPHQRAGNGPGWTADSSSSGQPDAESGNIGPSDPEPPGDLDRVRFRA